jgi:NAD(P)-dependent dehydrogenase (short-subunit alcohol dehydrogenase family)
MLVVPPGVTDAAPVAAAAARVHQEPGPIDLAVLSAGYRKQMDPTARDTEVLDQHVRGSLAGMSNSIAAVLPDMPWADVEKIILYPLRPRCRQAGGLTMRRSTWVSPVAFTWHTAVPASTKPAAAATRWLAALSSSTRSSTARARPACSSQHAASRVAREAYPRPRRSGATP